MTGSPDLKDLNRRSKRGGMITIGSQAVTMLMQLTSTVVLARMLTPDDYGVMGMVLSVVALAAIFKDLGLSSAAIQKQNLTVEHQTNLFWINSVFGLLLSGVVFAVAPAVAWFFGRPELTGMTWVLSLTFIFAGLGAQHNSMIVRNMQFGHQGIINVASIAVTFMVSVSLAALDFGFWSLAWGHVAGAAGRTALAWSFSPFFPGLWKRRVGTKELLHFGANVTGFNFVNYFSRNLDNVLIGKFAGADALGIYGRAYQLMMLPIQSLRGPIDAVTFPVLCKLQDKPEEWRRYHIQTLKVIAFLSMPLVAWMFLISSPLIIGLLGEQWAHVIPIFKILAIVAFVQPTSSMIGSALLSVGNTKRYFMHGVVVSPILAIAFAVGIIWGAEGVAWAYVAVIYVTLVPLLASTYRDTSVMVRDFFYSISIPASISITSLVITIVVMKQLEPFSNATEVLLKSAIYIGLFAISICAFPSSRKAISDAQKTLKISIRRSWEK
ncbi:lipopolysaccharide biosynthesis protein [Sulfitobacter sp. 1A12126]|uniref:lipopolysaccharide biosynthesis protein n=1 Tax=Sulfitobacter sp. 1A12126 TaxID=3368591 RepID=UPI003744E228